MGMLQIVGFYRTFIGVIFGSYLGLHWGLFMRVILGMLQIVWDCKGIHLILDPLIVFYMDLNGISLCGFTW